MEPEHTAHGIDFGSGFGQRLDWLDEAVGACGPLLDGGTVTSEPGGRYAFKDLRHHPLPVQAHLPIMIGGCGEKKTLRTVAKYADMWNAMGPLDLMAHKVEVLKRALRGRRPRHRRDRVHARHEVHDPRLAGRGRPRQAGGDRAQQDAHANVEDDVTFWQGTPEQIAERLAPYLELGFTTVISEQPAPYDAETIERFVGQVKPLIDAG